MKKELFLIRHAEAEPQETGGKDIDRNLTPDGEIVASKCGNFLSSILPNPDVVMCSSSVRTVQTAGRIVEQLDYSTDRIVSSEELYEASTRILLRVVNELEDAVKKAVLIVHNPSISYLSEYITGAEIGNVSPAGIVHVSYEGAWAEISEKSADLVQYYPPYIYSAD